MILTNCTQRKYIPPKPYKVYLLKQCRKVHIVPNKDGSLSKIEHIKLLGYAKCKDNKVKFYEPQLKRIGGI